MKKLYTLFLITIVSMGYSQTTINFDANAAWTGYMSWTGPSGNGEGGWGVADLVAIIDGGGNTATLKPNRINDLDPYWQTTPAGLLGEKIMTASLYVEDMTLGQTNFDWTGNVSSFGIDPQFTVSAFIKVFAAGYALLDEFYVPINATGDYTLNYDGSEATAAIVQYGFVTVGPNVNPEAQYDTDYNNFGSIVVTEASLSTNDVELSQVKAFPNPTENVWNITTNSQNIQSIALYDVLGKQVFASQPNSSEVTISSEKLSNGLYFAKVKTVNGESNLRLVKH